jgi:hypothetical protein
MAITLHLKIQYEHTSSMVYLKYVATSQTIRRQGIEASANEDMQRNEEMPHGPA